MIAMNSKHLWSVIIASEDSYDSHDQWSHMIAMNTDCEQSLFIGTAMNLDSERSMIKHIIHDEVGSMLWNAGVHTWSTLILYHIMTPSVCVCVLYCYIVVYVSLLAWFLPLAVGQTSNFSRQSKVLNISNRILVLILDRPSLSDSGILH